MEVSEAAKSRASKGLSSQNGASKRLSIQDMDDDPNTRAAKNGLSKSFMVVSIGFLAAYPCDVSTIGSDRLISNIHSTCLALAERM